MDLELTSNALGGLADSRWMLLNIRQRATARFYMTSWPPCWKYPA